MSNERGGAGEKIRKKRDARPVQRRAVKRRGRLFRRFCRRRRILLFSELLQ